MKYVAVLFASGCEVVYLVVLKLISKHPINHSKHIGILGSANECVVVMLWYCMCGMSACGCTYMSMCMSMRVCMYVCDECVYELCVLCGVCVCQVVW